MGKGIDPLTALARATDPPYLARETVPNERLWAILRQSISYFSTVSCTAPCSVPGCYQVLTKRTRYNHLEADEG